MESFVNNAFLLACCDISSISCWPETQVKVNLFFSATLFKLEFTNLKINKQTKKTALNYLKDFVIVAACNFCPLSYLLPNGFR